MLSNDEALHVERAEVYGALSAARAGSGSLVEGRPQVGIARAIAVLLGLGPTRGLISVGLGSTHFLSTNHAQLHFAPQLALLHHQRPAWPSSRRIMAAGDLFHELPLLWLVVVSCSLLTDLLRNRPEGGAISQDAGVLRGDLRARIRPSHDTAGRRVLDS